MRRPSMVLRFSKVEVATMPTVIRTLKTLVPPVLLFLSLVGFDRLVEPRVGLDQPGYRGVPARIVQP